MLNQFSEFLSFCKEQHQNGNQTLLATIVETQGSSYQKAGARMIISSDGTFNGILAGGCFEGDLVEQSQSVFQTGISKQVYYDMRSPDDVIWGLGLGCDGAVKILLQKLEPDNSFEPLSSLAHAAKEKNVVFLTSVINTSNSDGNIDETLVWNVSEKPEITNKSIESVLSKIDITNIKKASYQEISVDENTLGIFTQKILPPRHILLLGAGPDVMPLAAMALQLRWQVTIADHRPANLDSTRFPSSVELCEVSPDTITQDLALEHFDSMVLMTHSYDYDLRYLKALGDSPIPYIGLLGPSHRRDRLYNDLGQLAEKIQSRSHGPIGVNIGSKTPEEIALSILAELQCVHAGKTGELLDQRPLASKAKSMT